LIRRIFIAIPSPPEISTYLEQLISDNPHIPGIKWMRFFNLHLTIYFIGNINAEDYEKILDTSRLIINSHKKIILDFEKISFAPSENSKMIWVRFYKNLSFTSLVNSLHEGLKSVVPENKFYYKDPIPHITLARFKPGKILNEINIERTLDLKQIIITTCDLMESISSPKGVIYKKAASGIYLAK